MKYKRYIFPILMGMIMSNIMSLLNTGKIVFPAIFVMMTVQSVISSIASLIFPAGLVGAKITKKLFPDLQYATFLLISSVLPAIYFTAIMSISGLLRMKGFSADFWHIYFSSLPVYTIYGYTVSIFLNLILDKLLNPRGFQNE